jgi:signal transduction histidine kinase
MLLFALLSMGTAAVTALTLTILASQRMNASMQDQSAQYARQLQREMESVVAFNDRLTARERFESLMSDKDVDGLAVYTSKGDLIEGRGTFPAHLRSLAADFSTDTGHALTVADIKSREGRDGRLYVSLSTQSIDQLQRRNAWVAVGVATAVVLCAMLLARWASRRVVERLQRISHAADRMASGDLTHVHVDELARDEIGSLAHAFNSMVSELTRLSKEHDMLVSTERERLENQVSERTQALEQSREMFRLIAESTKAVPFTLDLAAGAFPYVGSQASVSWDVPEHLWKEAGALDVIFPRAENQDMRSRFDDCAPGRFEFEAALLRQNGARSVVRWTGTCEISTKSKYLRGLMLDVTELRDLERELAAAQKLESVGRLAAGVAHEINTPVQFVSDYVQFAKTAMTEIAKVVLAYHALQEATKLGSNVLLTAERAAQTEVDVDLDYLMKDVPLALEGAVEGLRRIATIVRSMKEFAHPDQAEKTYANLNQAIQSTLVVANHEYKYVAKIVTLLGELPLVSCYLGEINQVVLNLVVNASHAMADVVKQTGELGTLTICTRLDGDAVEISIADTGTGIPESARDSIFDPFFTTKEVGKGTGQGLAIARSIVVNKHGGTLRFETECGKGTTFFVRLPTGTLESPQTQAAA